MFMKFPNRFDGITADDIFTGTLFENTFQKRNIIIVLQLRNFHSSGMYIGILRFNFWLINLTRIIDDAF